MSVIEDRRRWQRQIARDRLEDYDTLDVMIMGPVVPASVQTLEDGSTAIVPGSCPCWVCQPDDSDNSGNEFRRLIVLNFVIQTAVYTPGMPVLPAFEFGAGPFGRVQYTDGIPELVWFDCPQ